MLEIGGHSYGPVTVTMVTATDIFFSYSGGMRNAKLSDLSPALQRYFHYNAEKAREVETAEAQASIRYYESVADAPQPAAIPATGDPMAQLFSKVHSTLAWSKIYMDAFLLVLAVFFMTNIACFISGRRSMRARRDLDQRLASLALIDLNNSRAPRQIAPGPRQF